VPHWWVPVRASRPEDRKNDVKKALQGKGNLNSFWEGSDGNLYALIKDCDGIDDDLRRELKAVGDPIQLEREV
jgi:hypothetical protein